MKKGEKGVLTLRFPDGEVPLDEMMKKLNSFIATVESTTGIKRKYWKIKLQSGSNEVLITRDGEAKYSTQDFIEGIEKFEKATTNPEDLDVEQKNKIVKFFDVALSGRSTTPEIVGEKTIKIDVKFLEKYREKIKILEDVSSKEKDIFKRKHEAYGVVDGILHGIMSPDSNHHNLYIKHNIFLKDIICEIACKADEMVQNVIDKFYEKHIRASGLIGYIGSIPQKINISDIKNIELIPNDEDLPSIDKIRKIFT